MRAGASNFVAVVVPAFNAERTLAETLRSVAAQTHRALEIIIVDDGSTDTTGLIAERFCAAESRARLVRQANGGVARARNAAIAASTGEFIAPVDADDLWHPDKLRRQLAVFADADERLGLVYCWYRQIDESGLVTHRHFGPAVTGDVFDEHLRWNFVGNGSTPLIRRSALGPLRYEPLLRDRGVQGCEDYLLQLQLARRCCFAVVPAYLAAYRQTPLAMSADARTMVRSHIEMLRILRVDARAPDRPKVDYQIARWRAFLGLLRGRDAAWAEAAALIALGFRTSPRAVSEEIIRQIALKAGLRRLRDRSGRCATPRPFRDLDPDVR